MYKNKSPSTIATSLRSVFTSIVITLYSCSIFAQQEERELEEIVVTGSFISGSPTDAPSPVQVVDRSSIEAQGATAVWDVIKNLGINSGSFSEGGSGEVTGTVGTAQVNLRNLGENSTLTLINGKRVVPSAALTHSGGEFVDLNAIPLVMTERMEILTDGGSALYGADAVAGVVNMIMRTKFEGFELYGDYQTVDGADGVDDTTISGIWGWASESGNTHFVISGERYDRDLMPVTDGNFYDPNTALISGNVSAIGGPIASPFFGANMNPAWRNSEVEALNVAEWGSTSTVYTDPLCESGVTDANGNTFFVDGEHPLQRSLLGQRSGGCRVDESQWAALSYETARNSFAASFDHQFGNGMELYAFGQYAKQNTIRSNSGYGRGFSNFFLPSPGAYSGGFYDGGVFELGHYAAEAGNTVPTNITNNPQDLANGGPNVANYSSFSFGVDRPGNDENRNKAETSNLQLGLKGDFDLDGRSYSWDVSYSGGYSTVKKEIREFSRERAHLAAMGLGGPNCVPNGVPDFDFINQPGSPWAFYEGYYRVIFEGFFAQPYEPISLGLTSSNQGQGDCMFYNPFLTSLTDPNLANSDELMNWISVVHPNDDRRNTLHVFDATITGDMFEMAGGTAAFAAGIQRRERNAKSRGSWLSESDVLNTSSAPVSLGLNNAIFAFDPATNEVSERGWIDNNLSCASCTSTYDLDQNTNAVFVELSLPFLQNIESQIALRWEDYGGAIGSQLSPKLAISWRPIEDILVRTSWSQSFRAPNPGIIGDGLDSSSATFLDPLKSQDVRAGLLPPTIDNATLSSTYTLGAPAPNVGNESADTFSAGFIWKPSGALDGLHFQTDFWRFEVRDRVLPETAGSAMKRQVERFLEVAADPNNYILNDSLDAGAAIPYESCDPNALAATFGENSNERRNCVVDVRLYQVDGVEESLLNPDRGLIQLRLSAINAGEITADGADFKIGYSRDTELGRFSSNLDYTYVHQYKLSNVPGLENGLLDIGVFDAAGTTGDGNLVRSLPDHKANLTLDWSNENQGLTLIGHYIGSYEDISVEQRLQDPRLNDLSRSLLDDKIESYMSWDLQYRYSFSELKDFGSPTLTLGVLDLFDADLPYREPIGIFDSYTLNYDGTVFDPRGRRYYLRALWQF